MYIYVFYNCFSEQTPGRQINAYIMHNKCIFDQHHNVHLVRIYEIKKYLDLQRDKHIPYLDLPYSSDNLF